MTDHDQVRTLRAELVIARNVARKWENDYHQLKAEFLFLQGQNDRIVNKLETTRRQLDHLEHAFGYKIPSPPPPTRENVSPVPAPNHA